MSSFVINKRPNTANIDLKNHDEVNEKIKLFYKKSGTTADNFVQLFHSLLNYAVTSENPSGVLILQENEVVVTQDFIDGLQLEIKELTESVNNLKNEVSSKDEQITDLFQKDLTKSEALENVLLVPVTPEQKDVLTGIGINRLRDKGYSLIPDTPDSAADIIKQIAFREPYLYNHWMDFYTGL